MGSSEEVPSWVFHVKPLRLVPQDLPAYHANSSAVLGYPATPVIEVVFSCPVGAVPESRVFAITTAKCRGMAKKVLGEQGR